MALMGGEGRNINEQSWHVTENNMIDKLNWIVILPSPSMAGRPAPPKEFWNAGVAPGSRGPTTRSQFKNSRLEIPDLAWGNS